GEIVAFDGDVTSFSRLQARMQNARPSTVLVAAVPVYYYMFDLIWFDGYDLSALPLSTRKSLLRQAFAFDDPIRFSEHLDQDGESAFRAACEKGWEGLIAKRAASPYAHARSKDWLKFKCGNEQEFIVIGWTDPRGARSGLGALLVGYYEDGDLRFGGKVGTGFGEQELTMLSARLRRLERSTSPLRDTKGIAMKGVHWVRPQLVAQVGFAEWTPDGKLRHPRDPGPERQTRGRVHRLQRRFNARLAGEPGRARVPSGARPPRPARAAGFAHRRHRSARRRLRRRGGGGAVGPRGDRRPRTD